MDKDNLVKDVVKNLHKQFGDFGHAVSPDPAIPIDKKMPNILLESQFASSVSVKNNLFSTFRADNLDDATQSHLAIQQMSKTESEAPYLSTLDPSVVKISFLQQFERYAIKGTQSIQSRIEPEFFEFWCEYIGVDVQAGNELSSKDFFDLLKLNIQSNASLFTSAKSILATYKMESSHQFSLVNINKYTVFVRKSLKDNAILLRALSDDRTVAKAIVNGIEPEMLRDLVKEPFPANPQQAFDQIRIHTTVMNVTVIHLLRSCPCYIN